jgi:uncharacterized membrane protein
MKYTWKSELPSLLCIAAMLVLLVAVWPSAPDRIPMHWNLRGEIDGYGGRFEGLTLLPIAAIVVYIMMRFLPAIDPRRSNYASFATAYNTIRHGTLVLLTVLYGLTIAIMRGSPVDMGIAVSTLIGLFVVLVGALMPTIRPNWFFGIRTPWTLSSDVAWTRAHRVGGRTFIVTGAALMAAGWIRTLAAVIVMASILVVGMLLTLWVAFSAWRDDPKRERTP